MGERVALEGDGEVVKGCLVWGPEEDFRNISPRAVEAIGLLVLLFLFMFF